MVTIIEKDYTPDMPDLMGFEYVIECLGEIGFVNHVSGGSIPLNWQDLDSWRKLTRRELAPMFDKMLLRLSGVYCSQYNLSHRFVPSPYGGEDDTDQARIDYATNVATLYASDKAKRVMGVADGR